MRDAGEDCDSKAEEALRLRLRDGGSWCSWWIEEVEEREDCCGARISLAQTQDNLEQLCG